MPLMSVNRLRFELEVASGASRRGEEVESER